VACFAAGWLALFVATVSPVGALGDALFSAYATRQGILLLIAAPMLALGRPLTALPGAAPAWRRKIERAVAELRALAPWRMMTGPFVAWVTYAAALWLWHTPTLFQAALAGGWARGAQQLSLFVSALVFWGALMRGHERQAGYGATVIYLIAACAHT